VKEHPDRKPRRPVTVKCGNDDDANRNQEFESKRIYVNTSASFEYEKGC